MEIRAKARDPRRNSEKYCPKKMKKKYAKMKKKSGQTCKVKIRKS